jgi:hypothetical protein
VTMSTILASRFVTGIRSEVERVEKQLNVFSDTLDQWVQVRSMSKLATQHHQRMASWLAILLAASNRYNMLSMSCCRPAQQHRGPCTQEHI